MTSSRSPVPIRRRLVRDAILGALVASSDLNRLRGRLAKRTTLEVDFQPALGSTATLRVGGRLCRILKLGDIAQTSPLREAGTQGIGGVELAVTLLNEQGRPAAPPSKVRTDPLGFFETRFNATSDAGGSGIGHAGAKLFAKAILGRTILAGTGRCTVLGERARSTVVVSDIDQTYLVSRIRGSSDLIRILASPGSMRRTLPGMRELTAALSRGRSLVFLTGTPYYFRRTLEAKFEADGMNVHGLFCRQPLVPADGRMTLARSRASVAALRYQFAFKLVTLLSLAADVPNGTEFVLLGDDSQSDPLTYLVFAAHLDRLIGVEEVLSLARREKATEPELAALELALDQPLGTQRSCKVRFVGIRRVNGPGLEAARSVPHRQFDAIYEDAPELARKLASAGLLQ